MINATMPEPVAWRIRFAVSGDFDQIDYHSHNAIGDYRAIYPDATSTPLITTDQAEAYAAAKVREALEEAAQACEARIGTGSPGIDTGDCDAEATECAAAIRALIPQHDNE